MSLKRYAHLATWALDQPWAITPAGAAIVASIMAERITGTAHDRAATEAAIAARKNDLPQPTRGGVAVIPAYGVLSPRANMLSESSGGTSFERLGQYTRKAANDKTISTIVFDVDSPGGSVAGAAEFAALLREVRASKPVIAVANHQMASAAYWVFANATKIHASPSAGLGSIGVFTIHNDVSAALEKLGVKRTLIGAGKYKLEGFDGEPLTEEAHGARSALVAKTYERFVADVAKGRGATVAAVRGGYGEGRIVMADDALEAGMCDKIATLDETLERLLPAGASLDPVALQPTHDTAQEPHSAAATAQDRRVDCHWQIAVERDLLEWGMSTH